MHGLDRDRAVFDRRERMHLPNWGSVASGGRPAAGARIDVGAREAALSRK
jgi:hypothetical protein